jgi:hypothetical protein
MTKILEQIEDFLAGTVPDIDVDIDEELFDKMVAFITSLDPEQLTEDQLEKVMDIVDGFEFGEIDEIKLLKKTSRKTRKKAKIYRRKNKAKIKAWRRRNKNKLKRSKKTGRGLSGKRRGKTRRRPGGPRG